MEALKDLKRSKRKSVDQFNKELKDLKGLVNEIKPGHPNYSKFMCFILENAEKDRADKRKRVVLAGSSSRNVRGHDDENQPAKRRSLRVLQGVSGKQPVQKGSTSRGKSCARPQQVKSKGVNEDQPVKRNTLVIKEKEGRENAGTSNPGKTQEKGKAKVTEDEAIKRNILLKIKKEGENSDTSNPVSEKQCEQAQDKTQEKGKAKVTEDEPVQRNIVRKIKEGENADTSNPVSEKKSERAQGKTQEKVKGTEDEQVEKKKIMQVRVKVEGQKEAGTITRLSEMTEVIEIDDDDEDEDLADQPGPEKKGYTSSLASEGAPPSQLKLPLSPLVPSRLFNDGNESELAFRDEVLKELRKPYNGDEYTTLQDAMMDGSYLDRYEDLKRLVRSQYKREKRLAIFRGFFFWLQNMDREGAFRPWNDCVCLEVDPPHVGDN